MGRQFRQFRGPCSVLRGVDKISLQKSAQEYRRKGLNGKFEAVAAFTDGHDWRLYGPCSEKNQNAALSTAGMFCLGRPRRLELKVGNLTSTGDTLLPSVARRAWLFCEQGTGVDLRCELAKGIGVGCDAALGECGVAGLSAECGDDRGRDGLLPEDGG